MTVIMIWKEEGVIAIDYNNTKNSKQYVKGIRGEVIRTKKILTKNYEHCICEFF